MALSETALAFAQETRFRRHLDGATHYGVAGSPGGGPYFQLWLIVRDGHISEACYQTHGCPSSMAVGGGLCRLIHGRKLQLAQTLTIEELSRIVGTIGEGKEFCFSLAIDALQSAAATPTTESDQ